METRICPKCKDPESRITSRQGYCKKCRRDAEREKYQSDPQHRQRKIAAASARARLKFGERLEALCGITLVEYYDQAERQEHGCWICRKPFGQTRATAAKPDHDHETGEFRGLLCGTCNLGLGNFYDSIELLKRAIQYLKQHAVVVKLAKALPSDGRDSVGSSPTDRTNF